MRPQPMPGYFAPITVQPQAQVQPQVQPQIQPQPQPQPQAQAQLHPYPPFQLPPHFQPQFPPGFQPAVQSFPSLPPGHYAMPTTAVVPYMQVVVAQVDPRMAPAIASGTIVDPASEALHQMFDAVDGGKVTRLQSLLQQWPGLLNALSPGPNGMTLLSRACWLGKVDIVDHLLKLKADVRARSRDGHTPLMYAARGGHAEVIRRLSFEPTVALNATRMAVHPVWHPQTALMIAVIEKNLEACKGLVLLGARLCFTEADAKAAGCEGQKLSALHLAITTGFHELIDWLLTSHRLYPETTEMISGSVMMNAVIAWGTPPMVDQMLARMQSDLARQPVILAKSWDKALYHPMLLPDGTTAKDAWQVAEHFRRFDMIECLLGRGLRPREFGEGIAGLINEFKSVQAMDLVLHARLLAGDAHAAADGLNTPGLGQQLHQMLDNMAAQCCLSSLSQLSAASHVWLERGLSALLLCMATGDRSELIASVRLLGRQRFPTGVATDAESATPAQQLQVLVEQVSDACGHPELHQPYSGRGLTGHGELSMNQMLDLQSKQMLQAIAHHRQQFAQRVEQLPALCLRLAQAGTLDEAGLYHALTHTLGLHDPIACAVLRLAQQASDRVRHPQPGSGSPASSLPTAAQMRQAMVAVLSDWDKIPEIVAAIREAETLPQTDIVADLLFQQWRRLCHAFDVEKARWQLYGPHKPGDGSQAPGVGVARADQTS